MGSKVQGEEEQVFRIGPDVPKERLIVEFKRKVHF